MRKVNSIFSKFIFFILFINIIVIFFHYFLLCTNKNEATIIMIEDTVLTSEEKEILDLINEQRIENGLGELKPTDELQKVARQKAEDIVNNSYFSHTSPTYGNPFEMMNDKGIKYKCAGENLAGNQTGENAVIAWMNSPSHKDNILDINYNKTGICVIDSKIYGKVYVQLFIGV